MAAVRCICLPVCAQRECNDNTQQHDQCKPKRECKQIKPRPRPVEPDLCEIERRSKGQGGGGKHDDFGCHYQGEKRQNLINTLKMFLADFDDRPVMKRHKKDEDGKGGKANYGPLIKYPGYVDYEHPYFDKPFNKLPDLAFTINPRLEGNPCPPITLPPNYGDNGSGRGEGEGGSGGSKDKDGCGCGCCCCAKRQGTEARCFASKPKEDGPRPRPRPQGPNGGGRCDVNYGVQPAYSLCYVPQPQPQQPSYSQYAQQDQNQCCAPQSAPAQTQNFYYCYPLPDNC